MRIVAVKATFVVREDGGTELHPVQAPVASVPVHRGDPAASSLLLDGDLLESKAATDVIVEGEAHAPRSSAVRSLDVALGVQQHGKTLVQKRLRVLGNRIVQSTLLGVTTSAPEPFITMPLTYERAFGGTQEQADTPGGFACEPRNPVGTGFATERGQVVGRQAPNIEHPDHPYQHWRRGQPAGFGPVARHWSPRAQLAGTYDSEWEKNQHPLLPHDFDPRYYQCAPADQQVPDFLKGGEVITCHHMTPDGVFRVTLPSITFGLTTVFYDRSRSEHRANLHTVRVCPSQRAVQMVWHSALPCHVKVNKLKETRIFIKPRVTASAAF